MSFKKYKSLKDKINNDLINIYTKGPKTLVDTYQYTLSGSGKRIRPLLVILCSKSLKNDYSKSYNAALAIEILHNFTLIHDDIMDKDTLRHGKKTVHEKWDDSTAILSGDLLLAQSLSLMTKSNYSLDVLNAFNKGLITVCEGQAYDKEFETKENVSEIEYLEMIEKKTSYLLGMCLQISGMICNLSNENIKNLFNYGINIGRGFQIQDDYLEIMSNQNNMQKSLNSDIILGKKTYPILLAKKIDKKYINKILKYDDINFTILKLREFILENNLDKEIKSKIDTFFDDANNCIKSINFLNDELFEFVKLIKNRKK